MLIDRRAKVQSGQRITSFTYLLNDKRGAIGRALAAIPPAYREVSFMGGQLGAFFSHAHRQQFLTWCSLSVLYHHRAAGRLPTLQQRILELSLHPAALLRMRMERRWLLHRSLRPQVSQPPSISAPSPGSDAAYPTLGSSGSLRHSARNSQKSPPGPSAPAPRSAPRATTTCPRLRAHRRHSHPSLPPLTRRTTYPRSLLTAVAAAAATAKLRGDTCAQR